MKRLVFVFLAGAFFSILAPAQTSDREVRDQDRHRHTDRERHRTSDRNKHYQEGVTKVGEPNPYEPKVGAPNPYATQGGTPNPYATQGGTPANSGAGAQRR